MSLTSWLRCVTKIVEQEFGFYMSWRVGNDNIFQINGHRIGVRNQNGNRSFSCQNLSARYTDILRRAAEWQCLKLASCWSGG